MRSILSFLLVLGYVVAAHAQAVQVSPIDHNTSADDFAPAPTQNGRVLIISSDKSGRQQLYGMERTSSGWDVPVRLRGDVNDGDMVGAASLTSDGQTMVFSATNHDVEGHGRTDLYMAKKSGGSWNNITNLGGTVNSQYFDSQPTLAADGTIIIFTSDRPGGLGGTDLYISQLVNGTWSAARPLDGANSPANEMGAVLNPDGKTVTFASDKAGGLGGFDIYVGTLSNGKLSNIRAAEAPINSAASEMFYASVPNSNQAFFARTSASGDYDIYTAVPNPFPGDPVTTVEGVVQDITNKQPLGADMVVTDLTTQKVIATLRSDDQTGEYVVTLPAGRVYSITAKSPGYLFHSERYQVPPNAKSQVIKKDIYLSPLKGGGARLLVFFDFDKSELKSESYPELERVIELLRQNPGMKVRFEGHTDDQGEAAYNQNLSEKRAKAVADYVVSGGITASHVSSVGFGKTQPLMDGASDEARAMNRRVEMKVVQ
ncbi:MAG: hypothetical protein D8M52_02395 [Chlorobi bacterium]|nr:MAG: OmpA family protein [Bacteroidota bacterium]MBE2266235.1 PD40 domain-containing protein [Flavobacteriales bacterium]MBL1160551.1 hypothetical protein [Chlorobiota bacterium]MBW7853201.1 PD40 domain-containing protein [Candidatus Kapabacteria bacterium]MCC6331310.1 PD40 domain-containing protein [Ignavibacteria bacterium]